MWKFAIAAAVLGTVFLLFRTAILELIRSFGREEETATDLTPDEILAHADGRTILVGENHGDVNARGLVNALLQAAHERGYRVLGIAASAKNGPFCSGLDEDLETLNGFGDGPIPPHDERSELDRKDGIRPRMNRYWQMRAALRLGWEVVPLGSYDGAIAESLGDSRPMIAVCGYGQLCNLHELLDDAIVYVRASPTDTADAGGDSSLHPQIAFAANVPILRYT